jgi:hypothetical protein
MQLMVCMKNAQASRCCLLVCLIQHNALMACYLLIQLNAVQQWEFKWWPYNEIWVNFSKLKMF